MWGKNELPARLLTVFQEEDKYMDEAWARRVDEANAAGPDCGVAENDAGTPDEAYDSAEETEPGAEDDLFGYTTTVATVLSRLKLMGFRPEKSRRVMASVLLELREWDGEDALYEFMAGSSEPTRFDVSCEDVVRIGLDAYLKSCGWWGPTGDAEPSHLERACLNRLDLFFENDEDPRLLLSALLDGQDPGQVLRLDLSDLLAADYFRSIDEVSTRAIEELRESTVNTGPIIVITEGKFDSRVLQRALKLVRPDIAGYFKFWDLETSKASGGTDRVVANLRSFAAAGVMNRVIGLLDNDTAGRQAEKQLASAPLPKHYGYCRLPDLDYGRSYPTLGPSGRVDDDINQRACSIEFYFGLNCLRAPDGSLISVRWKGYNEAISDYQGELVNKAYVQGRIEDALNEAETCAEILGDEWDPMRKLAQRLIDVAEAD
ncbi:hypothetical protein [Streptomyces sp. Caat 7-52]|uniref:hypothetical protein n=1 Tax=Streptomyces sp. Caat 7-52 TaxID=2949637 RepID=UPI0020360ACE|nr:hypothetical protein [Streptomyces sp. Caat 7-52]